MIIEPFYPYIFTLIIVVAILIFIKRYADFYLKLKQKELLLLQKNVAPVQDNRAYPRMLIFLERIKPARLVKEFSNEISPKEYYLLVEKTIQTEYEFNLSQQALVKPEIWTKITRAKDIILQILNDTLKAFPENGSLNDYKSAFMLATMSDDTITDASIAINNEINNFKIKNNES